MSDEDTPRSALQLAKQTLSEWWSDDAPRHAAALSFYTALSLAPVLLIAVAVTGLVFGRDAAEGRIVGELQGVMGRSTAMVFAVAFLLLVSLLLSAGLTALGNAYHSLLPVTLVWQAVNLAVSLVVMAALFALIFKYLPDAKVAWKDVWVGAAFTSALFALGKLGISQYVGRAAVESSHGAAGSVVVFLVWSTTPRRFCFWEPSSPRCTRICTGPESSRATRRWPAPTSPPLRARSSQIATSERMSCECSTSTTRRRTTGAALVSAAPHGHMPVASS